MVRMGGMQPAGSARWMGDSAPFIPCRTLVPTLLHRQVQALWSACCNVYYLSQKIKAIQKTILMKVSPYGCNHQRCQPAAGLAIKATGYPMGM